MIFAIAAYAEVIFALASVIEERVVLLL